MYRSDTCYECEEPVYDMDVCCYECGSSYCSKCGEGYDPISRTCLLYAHANVYVNPSFTVGQLRQYEKDIPYLINQNPKDLTEDIKELLTHYRNEEDVLKEEHQCFFSNLLLDNDEYTQNLDFKCYACKFPPVKQLFVIESDIQFYVRIQTAIDAITPCLDDGVKILVYDLIETEYKFVINDKQFFTVYPDKILEHLYDDVIRDFRIYSMPLKNKINEDLDEELNNDLTKELNNDLTKELNNDLTKELDNDLTKELNNDLTKELNNDLTKDNNDK